MNAYRDARFVTANYRFLQGLYMIPMGVALLAIGCLMLWGQESLQPYFSALVAGLLMLAFVAMLPIRGYYHRHIGQAESLHGSGLRDALWGGLIGVCIVVLMVLERSLHLPVSLGMIAFGIFFLYTYLRSENRRKYYLVFSIVLIAAGLSPLTGWIQVNAFFGSTRSFGLLMLGIIYILGGWFDHRLLVRLLNGMRTSPEALHENPV
jgi:hypothetical protein